jgi:predicted nucleic acid-binding protein
VPAFLDTNILIHHLTGEDGAKAVRCRDLLQRAEQHQEELVTSDLVIAEVVWVLESRTALSRERIRDLVLSFVRIPGLRLRNKSAWARVFDLYCDRRVDLIDAYNAVLMDRLGVGQVYSYDTDFDRIEGIERLNP